MTAADEYQRVLLPLVHCPWCDLGEGEPCHEWGKPVEHMHEQRIDAARHLAQALAADPGVRAAVEREARAEVLAEVDQRIKSAFRGEEFEENAAAAGGEGEWQWFGWLAREQVRTYRQDPSDGE